MPYTTYKLIHFLGLFTLIVALAVTATHALMAAGPRRVPGRRLLLSMHGIALFLVLLGGFGMLARLGVVHGGLPAWVFVKLGIWLLFGAAIVPRSRLSV